MHLLTRRTDQLKAVEVRLTHLNLQTHMGLPRRLLFQILVTLRSSVPRTLSPASWWRGQPRAAVAICAGGLHGWPGHCIAPAVALPTLPDVRTVCQLRQRPMGEAAQPERACRAQVATALNSLVTVFPRLATMMDIDYLHGPRY